LRLGPVYLLVAAGFQFGDEPFRLRPAEAPLDHEAVAVVVLAMDGPGLLPAGGSVGRFGAAHGRPPFRGAGDHTPGCRRRGERATAPGRSSEAPGATNRSRSSGVPGSTPCSPSEHYRRWGPAASRGYCFGPGRPAPPNTA